MTPNELGESSGLFDIGPFIRDGKPLFLPLTSRSTDARRPDTPASMMPEQRRKQQFEDTVDGAVMAASITKEVADAVPGLAPIGVVSGVVITLLEHLKAAKRNKEHWEMLSGDIAKKIRMVQEYIENKPTNTALQGLISDYRNSLEQVVREMDFLATTHETWLPSMISASSDEERMKDAILKVNELSYEFTTRFQVMTSHGSGDMQSGQ